MGLKSHEKFGIKRTLINKYSDAWVRYESLNAMVSGQSQSTDEVVHIIDGNVLMFGAPNVVRTLADYEEYLFDRLLPYLESCRLLIVSFDDPEHVPLAKHACQRKRDKARVAPEMTMSAELEIAMTAPTEEECTAERMEQLVDCRVMLAARAVRMRFIDEICVRVFGDLIEYNEARLEIGEPNTTLLFDNFDCRGTNRPPHAPREAHVYCTDADVYKQLEESQYDTRVGEADIKLNVYDQFMRTLDGYRIVALHTIDTDSIPISLLQQTKRLQERDGDVEPTRTLLCLRERGTAHLRCLDVQRLCQAMMMQCVSTAYAFDPQEAMFAIACTWALGGCDFVLPGYEMGTRPGVLFESMLLFLKDRGTQHFRHAHPGTPREELLHLITSLQVFAKAACDNSHPCGTAQHTKKVQNCDDDTLRKAIWTASYWRDIDFAANCCNVVSWKAWGFDETIVNLSTDLSPNLSPNLSTDLFTDLPIGASDDA